MRPLDWIVLFGALALFVAYGVWRGRGSRDLQGYLLAGRSFSWPGVALSVMATQASAITFLSTPGQAYVDGMRFVQFYFGLPLAMVVLCVTAIPIYHRLGVFTAYEYLEGRFDAKTRTLASGLFLIQRGLAAGLTLYAPALVLAVVLGWDVRVMCALLGGLAVVYTTSGGNKAVSHAHVLMFSIIMATMVVAFGLILASLPAGIGPLEALRIGGALGRLHGVNPTFDPNDRYTLWSGLLGGFFLQLSYFGTDQSQVARYLTGQSIAQSRLGLLFNGLAKVPMQFFILLLGVMVFVFYQFNPPPMFFNPALEARRVELARRDPAWDALDSRYQSALAGRADEAQALVGARAAGDVVAADRAARALAGSRDEIAAVRKEAAERVAAATPGTPASDTNYIFLHFVLHQLPIGLVGLVLAAIFAASMNSSSSELNALASTTVVDVYKRVHRGDTARHEVFVSRLATVGWTVFAVAFADFASRLGSLIEAVNILGSLFYGTILGIFLTAFYLKRVGGTAVFTAALVAEAAVIVCFRFTKISFLWYNLLGCAIVMIVALALSAVLPRREALAAP